MSRRTVVAVAAVLALTACPDDGPSVTVDVSVSEAPLERVGTRYVLDLTNGDESVADATMAADGTILLTGTASSDDGETGFVARVGVDGALVAGYGTDGVALLEFDYPDAVVGSGTDAVVLDGHGGSVSVRRITGDGAVATEAPADIALPVGEGRVGSGVTIADAAVDGEGRIVVAGTLLTNEAKDVGGCCAIQPDEQRFMLRLGAAGALDTAFGEDGVTVGELSELGSGISDVVVAGDGSIITTENEGAPLRTMDGRSFDALDVAPGARRVTSSRDSIITAGSAGDRIVVTPIRFSGERSRPAPFELVAPGGRELELVDLAVTDEGETVVLAVLTLRAEDGIPDRGDAIVWRTASDGTSVSAQIGRLAANREIDPATVLAHGGDVFVAETTSVPGDEDGETASRAGLVVIPEGAFRGD